MAYDSVLAERIERLLSDDVQCSVKKMFGGVCYLVQGNMACGIIRSDLIVRVGDEARSLLHLPGVREFDFTGRTMRNWVVVAAEVIADDKALQSWLRRGINVAMSLPAKN